MERYYMDGEAKEGDYEESFHEIIEAHNKKEAKVKLQDRFKGFVLEIENFYVTTWDARP